MASTKAKGSTKNGRDSRAQRLGVKIFGGQIVKKGQIIIRQRGSKFYAGSNVLVGGDDTIFAAKDGTVAFADAKIQSFSGKRASKTFVSVK